MIRIIIEFNKKIIFTSLLSSQQNKNVPQISKNGTKAQFKLHFGAFLEEIGKVLRKHVFFNNFIFSGLVTILILQNVLLFRN